MQRLDLYQRHTILQIFSLYIWRLTKSRGEIRKEMQCAMLWIYSNMSLIYPAISTTKNTFFKVFQHIDGSLSIIDKKRKPHKKTKTKIWSINQLKICSQTDFHPSEWKPFTFFPNPIHKMHHICKENKLCSIQENWFIA